MEQIEVDGFRLAFEQRGHGPAVVLLHGAFSDSRAWRHQLAGLSDELTVIAWDAPGCGASDDPPETFRLPEYADCLARFIDALGVERPHIVGLSFGGGLALELFHRHPEVPRSLVLASAYAGWAGSLPPEEVERRRARALRETERPPAEWVRDYLPGMFSASVRPEVIDETAAMMLDTRSAGMRPMLLGFAEADLRDVLPRIDVPTLLLYGDADSRSPLSVARDLQRRIPGSTLSIMPGVGHDSCMEAPDLFNAEVRRFLRSVAQR